MADTSPAPIARTGIEAVKHASEMLPELMVRLKALEDKVLELQKARVYVPPKAKKS